MCPPVPNLKELHDAAKELVHSLVTLPVDWTQDYAKEEAAKIRAAINRVQAACMASAPRSPAAAPNLEAEAYAFVTRKMQEWGYDPTGHDWDLAECFTEVLLEWAKARGVQ